MGCYRWVEALFEVRPSLAELKSPRGRVEISSGGGGGSFYCGISDDTKSASHRDNSPPKRILWSTNTQSVSAVSRSRENSRIAASDSAFVYGRVDLDFLENIWGTVDCFRMGF